MTEQPERSTDEADWDALARYFAGEGDPAEREAARVWLDAHPREAVALRALANRTASLAAGVPRGLDVTAAWHRLDARLDEADEPVVLGIGATQRSGIWRSPTMRIAAAIALIAAGTLLWSRSTHEPATVVAVAARTYTAAPGTRDSLLLHDGTRVLLGPGSSLRTEEAYGVGPRAVYLDGDALFEVVHDAAHPFTVSTAGATVEDLGTTFAVHTAPAANSGGTVTHVTVTAGTVRLRRSVDSAGGGVVLAAGDAGTTRGGAEIAVARAGGAGDALAWTEGRLVFRDTPVAEVVSMLQRWYGIRIQVADSTLNTRTFTASLKDEAPSDVMRMLALALDARVDLRDSVYVVGAVAATEERTK